MKRITDPDFEYVDAAHTDIRKTFRRERKRLEEEKAERDKRDIVTAKVYQAGFTSHYIKRGSK